MFPLFIFNIPVHMVVTQVVSVVDNVDISVLYIDNELVLIPEIDYMYTILYFVIVIFD